MTTLERTDRSGHLTRKSRLAIYACKDLYTVMDTARYWGVDKSTVRAIFDMVVRDDETPPPPPNIEGTKTTPDLIVADTQILLDRGMSLTEVAAYLGCEVSTIRKVHARAGRTFYVRNGRGVAA